MASLTETNFQNIAANSTSGTVSAAKKSALGLGNSVDEKFDMFLKLLTTQLKNQDPTAPMDADKFAEQLNQYSGIEQQLAMNNKLDTISSQLAANSMMGVMSFMGMEVTAAGKTTTLDNGSAKWNLQSPSSSIVNAKVTIRNAANKVVSEKDFSLKPGDQSYTWNGRDANGIELPEGEYTISIDAKDASGGVINVGTSTKGVITGIDYSGVSPIMLIGDKRLTISQIVAVQKPIIN